MILELVKKFIEVYGALPFVPVPSQVNLVHTILSYYFRIHFNIIFSSIPMYWKWSLSYRFPHRKSCMDFTSPPFVPHAPPILSSLFGSIIPLC